MLSAFAPHEPSTPAPRHQNLLPDISAPRPPSFNEEDMSDKSFDMSHNPLLSEDDIQRIDERYRQRVLSMLSVDEMIPEIFKTFLRKMGYWKILTLFLLLTRDLLWANTVLLKERARSLKRILWFLLLYVDQISLKERKLQMNLLL